MDIVLDRPLTTEAFLAWEDRQEGKHEFDGRDIIPTAGGSYGHQDAGGSYGHQDIVFHLRGLLGRLLAGQPYRVAQEMRLRIGRRVRYPDVIICPGPRDQTIRTETDAVAIFEVLADDTATTDRVQKLIEYAELPSLRAYVLLEQAAIAATMFRREAGGAWIATAHTEGALQVAGLDIALPLAEVYQGLTFSTAE